MNYIIKDSIPDWGTIRKAHPEVNSGADYENYMIENHGYSVMTLRGSIGYGSKVHNFRVLGKTEGPTLYVASCYSFCGSAKFTSSLCLSQNQELECNCKRCNQ